MKYINVKNMQKELDMRHSNLDAIHTVCLRQQQELCFGHGTVTINHILVEAIWVFFSNL